MSLPQIGVKLKDFGLKKPLLVSISLVAIMLMVITFREVSYSPKEYDLVKPKEMYVGLPGIPFNNPLAVAIDSKGDVYIADAAQKQIVVLTQNGRYLRRFSGQGSGLAELEFPNAVAVGPDKNIYVADSNKQAVLVFKPTGGYVRTIKDNYKDSFIPSGLCFIEDNLLVYNLAKGNFRLYDGEGKMLKEIGEKKLLQKSDPTPRQIAVVNSKNYILITNPSMTKVDVYSMKGKLIQSFGNGFFASPQGITYSDSSKRIYITDTTKHKVLVFDLGFNYIGEFGCYGDAMREFKNPVYINVDSNGDLYIADNSNGRVMSYSY